MRTAVAVNRRWRDAPVYLERIESLPVEEIEITESVREFHRASLVSSIYQGVASEYAWPEGARGTSYFHMAGLALDLLAPDRDFDMVILVTATPDCQFTHYNGLQFDGVLSGRPGLIGIGGQGVAGPFTALRLAKNHLRFGLADRALVIIMEQAMLPLMPDHLWDPRDGAVAIVVSRRSGLRLAAESIDRNGAPRPTMGQNYEDAVLIRGSGVTDVDFVAPHARFAEQYRAEGGYACVGVWDTLAARLPSLSHGRIVVTDVDKPLSYRCFLELTRTVPTRQETVNAQ